MLWVGLLAGKELSIKFFGFYKLNKPEGVNYRLTFFGLLHFIFAITNTEFGTIIILSVGIYKYAIGISFGEYNFLEFKLYKK